MNNMLCFFFFQAEDGIRDATVTGVQTCALPIFGQRAHRRLLTIRGGPISTTGIGFLVGVTPAAVHLARAAPSGVWLRAGCAILGGLLGAGVQGWGTTSACPMPSPFARAVRVALAGLAARASAAHARGRAAQPDGEPA